MFYFTTARPDLSFDELALKAELNDATFGPEGYLRTSLEFNYFAFLKKYDDLCSLAASYTFTRKEYAYGLLLLNIFAFKNEIKSITLQSDSFLLAFESILASVESNLFQLKKQLQTGFLVEDLLDLLFNISMTDGFISYKNEVIFPACTFTIPKAEAGITNLDKTSESLCTKWIMVFNATGSALAANKAVEDQLLAFEPGPLLSIQDGTAKQIKASALELGIFCQAEIAGFKAKQQKIKRDFSKNTHVLVILEHAQLFYRTTFSKGSFELTGSFAKASIPLWVSLFASFEIQVSSSSNRSILLMPVDSFDTLDFLLPFSPYACISSHAYCQDLSTFQVDAVREVSKISFTGGLDANNSLSSNAESILQAAKLLVE